MYKQFFAGMEYTSLPLFTLGLFLAVFALMALRTFVVQRRADFEQRAQQPLFDGTPVATSLSGTAPNPRPEVLP